MKATTAGALLMALAPLGSALVIPSPDMEAAFEPVAAESRPKWLDSFRAHDIPFEGEDSSSSSSSSSVLNPAVDLVDLDEDAMHALTEKASAFFDSILDNTVGRVTEHPHHPPPGHSPPDHDHPPTQDHTIWQLLERSEHGKKFTKLASDYKSIVEVLNSTSSNYTLFIPGDRAFEHIPHDHEKPTGKELEKFLQYHIVKGDYDAKSLWYHNTLPTLLEEKLLGDEQQRIRVRYGLKGVNVNGYSAVVMPNIRAKNGLIHAVDHVLVPPFMVGKGLSLFPTFFSTLLHAYAKTDFVSFIHSVPMEGSTMFAPSNHAFAKLGPRANAFLFETERGHKILKAILKYQIVANTTLYSDAAYGKLGGEDDVEQKGGRSTHYELKTLYENKSLGVDIWRWAGWTRISVNGCPSVVYADGVAKNGVVHVVNTLPMPPCPRRGHDAGYEGEMSIEELEDRFSGFVEEDDEKRNVVAGETNQAVLADL